MHLAGWGGGPVGAGAAQLCRSAALGVARLRLSAAVVPAAPRLGRRACWHVKECSPRWADAAATSSPSGCVGCSPVELACAMRWSLVSPGQGQEKYFHQGHRLPHVLWRPVSPPRTC